MSSNRQRVELRRPDRVSRVSLQEGRPRSYSGPGCYPNDAPLPFSPSRYVLMGQLQEHTRRSREELRSRTSPTNSPVSSPPPRVGSPTSSPPVMRPKRGAGTGSPKSPLSTLLVTKKIERRKSTTDMGDIDVISIKEDDKLSLYSSHTSIMSDPSTGQPEPLEEEEEEVEEEGYEGIDSSLSSELSSGANDKQNDRGCHDNSEPGTDLSDFAMHEPSDRVDTSPFVVPQLVISEQLSEEHLLIDKLSEILTTPISVHSEDIGVFVPGTSYKLLHKFNNDSIEYVTGMGIQSKSVTTITALGSSLNQLV